MLVHDVEYDSGEKKINFYNYDGELVCDLDATAFIKDGMVSNVKISGKYLVISFNTDAGKEDIKIPVTDIFNPNEYYKKSEIDNMVGGSLPIGTILMWPGTAQKIPEGFVICDGSQFDTSSNPTLYEILGSNRLPDLRDKFIVGAGSEYNIGATGGEKEHILTVEELPSHSHNYSSDGDDAWASNRIVDRTDKSCYGDSNYSSAWLYKTESTGNGRAHENRPPYYALFYIIKANIIIPEPSPEPEPDPEPDPTPDPPQPEPTTNMTITISNNTGSKIYASRLDFLGTTTSIRFYNTYEIVSSKTINISVNESIIGTRYTGIQIVDEEQAHCAYATNSGSGVISNIMSVTATQKFI